MAVSSIDPRFLVLPLKGNQETLYDDVRLHMADPENAEKMIRFNGFSLKIGVVTCKHSHFGLQLSSTFDVSDDVLIACSDCQTP